MVIIKISPAILGITDGITDITYFFSEHFAHPSIKEVFLAVLLFTPAVLTIIWDV